MGSAGKRAAYAVGVCMVALWRDARCVDLAGMARLDACARYARLVHMDWCGMVASFAIIVLMGNYMRPA